MNIEELKKLAKAAGSYAMQIDPQTVLALIAENDALRQELEEARSALETIAAQRSGIPGSTAKADCMASVAGLALRNMNAAREKQGEQAKQSETIVFDNPSYPVWLAQNREKQG